MGSSSTNVFTIESSKGEESIWNIYLIKSVFNTLALWLQCYRIL